MSSTSHMYCGVARVVILQRGGREGVLLTLRDGVNKNKKNNGIFQIEGEGGFSEGSISKK